MCIREKVGKKVFNIFLVAGLSFTTIGISVGLINNYGVDVGNNVCTSSITESDNKKFNFKQIEYDKNAYLLIPNYVINIEKNIDMQFKEISKFPDQVSDDRIQILKYSPGKYSFNHEKFFNDFKENCIQEWKDWLLRETKVEHIGIPDDFNPFVGSDKDIRLGIRFGMMKKTEDDYVYLIDGAKSRKESTGDISVSFSILSGEVKSQNIPEKWIYNVKKETRKGPLSFDIIDYRSVITLPHQTEDDRKLVGPIEKKTLHAIERISIPFPSDAGKFLISDSLKRKIRNDGELSDNESIYFAYPYTDPLISGEHSFYTRDINKIGLGAELACRERDSGSIFYTPRTMHQTKFKFKDNQAIYVKIPANAIVRVYYKGLKDRYVLMRMKDLVSQFVFTTFWNHIDRRLAIRVEETLLSELKIFNNKPNISLWEININNDNLSYKFLIEDYKDFPVKNFFKLLIKEIGERQENGVLSELPVVSLSLSPEAEQLIANLHYLRKQYLLIQNEILPNLSNEDQRQVFLNLANDIKEGKVNFEEVAEFLKNFKEHGQEESFILKYVPAVGFATWYIDAMDKFGINLSNIAVVDWVRILNFIGSFLSDKIYLHVRVGENDKKIQLYANGYFDDKPIIDNKELLKGKNNENLPYRIIGLEFETSDSNKKINFEDVFDIDEFKKYNNATLSEVETNDQNEIIYKFNYQDPYESKKIDLSSVDEESVSIKRDIGKEVGYNDFQDYYRFDYDVGKIQTRFNELLGKHEIKHKINLVGEVGKAWEIIEPFFLKQDSFEVFDRVVLFEQLNEQEINLFKTFWRLNREYNYDKSIFNPKIPENFTFYRLLVVSNANDFGDLRYQKPTKFMWFFSDDFIDRNLYPNASVYLVKFTLDPVTLEEIRQHKEKDERLEEMPLSTKYETPGPYGWWKE